MAVEQVGEERVGVKLRVPRSVKHDMEYYANLETQKTGHTVSFNELMVQAAVDYIARRHGDFDVPNLLVQRLNQLIDEQKATQGVVGNLAQLVTSGFGSVLALAKGDSYLDDLEDGELPVSATPLVAAAGFDEELAES